MLRGAKRVFKSKRLHWPVATVRVCVGETIVRKRGGVKGCVCVCIVQVWALSGVVAGEEGGE